MSSLALVVMAAGIGSRYGGLKQIDPVGPSGEVVLDYSVYDALRAGFDRVVFIIREDIEAAFREKIGRRIERAADTAYVFQSPGRVPQGFRVPEGRKKPWGTAHAILCAKDAVTTPFLAINADDYYGRTAFKAMADHLSRGPPPPGRPNSPWSATGWRIPSPSTARWPAASARRPPDGYLVGIRELLKIQRFPDGIKHTENDTDWIPLDPASWTSMNFWGFTPDLFGELERRFPEFLRRNAADHPQGRVPHPRGRRRAPRRGPGPGQDPADARALVRRDLPRGPAPLPDSHPRSHQHRGLSPGPLGRILSSTRKDT